MIAVAIRPPGLVSSSMERRIWLRIQFRAQRIALQLSGGMGRLLLVVVGRRLAVVAEKVRAQCPGLPLPAFGQQLIVGPLGDRPGRHSEEASHVRVFAAEGLPYCALGHVHGASVVR